MISSRYGGPTSTIDGLDCVLFLPCVLLACTFGFSLSMIGPAFLLVPLVCLLYGIFTQTVPPRWLSAYAVLCVVTGMLSYYRLFPTSWQIVFLPVAIPRQLIPVLSFLAMAWASKAYFRRRLQFGDVFFGEGLIVPLSFIVAPIVMMQAEIHYEGDDTASSVIAAYGSMINSIVIGLFFITGRLFHTRNASRFAVAAFILAVAATTHFVQFRLIAAAAFVILLGVRPRLVVLGVVGILILSYGIQLYDIPAAIAENPDKGIRVAFIADSFSSLFDTHFLGIGYGTESVRWTYRFPGLPDFTFMPDPKTVTQDRLLELLSRGVHNSFVQAMLRTGLLGGVLLVCAFSAAFPPRHISRPTQSHASVLFIIIFIACFVNPALESPVQLIGIGFIYGYLLALRAYTSRMRRVARVLTKVKQPLCVVIDSDLGDPADVLEPQIS